MAKRMGDIMGNRRFADEIKFHLDSGNFKFVRIMSDGGNRLHDGTNLSNEIGLWRLKNRDIIQKVAISGIMQKVMLSSAKYHQRRKALTEMVSAWLDEGLGDQRIVPFTYAEEFQMTDHYRVVWGDKPTEPGRLRVCHVVHEYLEGVPGDEWRGAVYGRLKDLGEADRYCRRVIESHPDAERIALLDFLTINQDRSARNWLTQMGERFYAIDNGMAWFHDYPHSGDRWKIGCVIDDVLLQKKPWQFISGIFTTSYAGKRLTPMLRDRLANFSWTQFCQNLDDSCLNLGISLMSLDWRFLGLRRRLEWIRDKGRFPTADEYRGWLNNGSELFTPPEIIATGGKIVWRSEEDRP